MMKEQYIKKVNQLLEEYRDDFILESPLLELKDRLLSVESSIAVVGQFSVGKSALLNALLGEDVLSTRRIESTKVLTKIKTVQKREEQKIRLKFKNGDISDLPIENTESLEAYTTFQGTEVTDDLSLVELYWPVSFLNEHLTLIDTPGANSLTADAFKVTEEALGQAAAIIYLFNGQKGMDQTDNKLITELLARQKKIFLVATHVDGLIDSDWSLVEHNVNLNLSHINEEEEIKLYPISSILALEGKKEDDKSKINESKIKLLEDDLRLFMETAAYESKNMQSIIYDFEALQREIELDKALLEEKERLKEIQRQQRYERLIAITQLNYRKVEQYGLKILKSRIEDIDEAGRTNSPNLATVNKKYQKGFKQEFQRFAEKAMIIINSPGLLMEEFKAIENRFKDIYQDWIDEIKRQNQFVIQEIQDETQKFDRDFVALMAQMKSDVDIDWKSFHFELKALEIQGIQLELDYSDLDSIINDYNEFQMEADKEQKNFETNENKTVKSFHEKQRTYEKELEKLDVDKKSLGSAPGIETKSSESGFWIFKKAHYYEDDSKLQAWNVKVKKIEEERQLMQRDLFETQEAFESKKDLLEMQREELLSQISDEEENIMEELMDIVLSSIDTNNSYADELAVDVSNVVSEQWSNQMKTYQLYEENRIQEAIELFKSFITKVEQEEINRIKVI